MSYQALARSERPQTFSEVVGQEPVTTTLKNAINQRRVGHAYLFTGPRGVGKTSTARILAKALNCLAFPEPTPSPCNQCANCIAITNGNSLDVIEIDGASNRGIEEIRSLRENVKFAPAGSRKKVYIIDEVHMLTEQAFNALLKTLEEPPEHVVFMFATTEPRKIPATILSRTQRFDLKEITGDDIFRHLKKLTTAKGIAADDAGLRLIAFKAHGSLRDSLSLLDQAIAYGDGKITTTAIGPLLGLLDSEAYYNLVELFIAQDTVGSLEQLSRITSEGYTPFDLVSGILAYLRHLLLVKVKAGKLIALERGEAELVKLETQAEKVSSARLLQFIQVLLPLESMIRKSSSAEILLELAVIKITEFGHDIPYEELLGRLEELEKSLEGGVAPVRQPSVTGEKVARSASEQSTPPTSPAVPRAAATTERSAAPAVSGDDQVKWWPIFLERLEADSKHAMQNHLHSHVVKVEQHGENIVLKIDNQTSYNSLKRPNNLEYLSAKIRDILGENFTISCEQVKSARPQRALSDPPAGPPVPALPKIDDPIIQMVIDKFKGQLTDFKPEARTVKEDLAGEKYE